MAKKQIAFTFHQVREQCERASGDAWRAFFRFYGPLSLRLLEMYDAGDAAAWEETVDVLTGNDFERLRAMPRQSEREFLMELRAELLERALSKAVGEPGMGDPPAGPGAGLDLERMTALIQGLPLLHQEILWFKTAGYTDATIERMLRVTPNVARAALDRLAADFGAIGELKSDHCPWPRDWLALLRQARASKKEDCPALHQLLRIHDGQVSWYDKEPVEKRVSSCGHCLESWTGLREVGYWRLAAPAIPSETIETWLQRVPIAETKKSLFRRVSR